MSKLQVNDIVNKDDNGSVGFSRGAVVTGVATATTFDGNVTGNVTGTAATFTTVEATTYINVPEGTNVLKAMLFV